MEGNTMGNTLRKAKDKIKKIITLLFYGKNVKEFKNYFT